MAKTKLILGVPSKGRLMEATSDYFGAAGMKIARRDGARNYKGEIKGLEGLEVRFMSASEIAGALISGDIHFGVTGRDLLHEQTPTPDDQVLRLTALGFGHADVVVAIPEAWIDVENMEDLSDVCEDFRARHHRPLRVATKYFGITRAFFAEHGIIDYRIVESAGATEGAPAAGTAEAIVDITSTGATLIANKLKILSDGVILASEAFLNASLTAQWSSETLNVAKAVLDQILARQKAKNLKEIRFDASAMKPAALSALRSDNRIALPFGVAGPGEVQQTLHVNSVDLRDVTSGLQEAGGANITVRDLDYVFSGENPLLAALQAQLPS